MTHSDKDRAALRDLDDVLTRAASIVARGRAAFDADDAIRLACEALAARIGEIARERLTSAYRNSRPDVPWSDIIRMRDLLLHQYHRTDYTIVWDTVSRQLPHLREQLAADLDAAGPTPADFSDVEADQAQKAHAAKQRTRPARPGREGRAGAPRCGTTDTADGGPCRNPVPSAGQRCYVHS